MVVKLNRVPQRRRCNVHPYFHFLNVYKSLKINRFSLKSNSPIEMAESARILRLMLKALVMNGSVTSVS